LPNPLAPLPIQYGDVVHSQIESLQGVRYDALLDYWHEKLKGVARLTLPIDRSRPDRPGIHGDVVERVIHAGLLRDLRAHTHRHNATLFMAMASVFQILLMRLSGQEDVAIGTPVANRGREDLQNLIGPFLNLVVLRTDLSGSPTFEQLLGRTRQTVMDALDRHDMPFDRLVGEINPQRELNHNPLFDVMINHIDGAPPQFDFPGLRVQPLATGPIAAKFALSLYIRVWGAHADVRLVYQTDLFSRVRAETLLDQFVGLVDQVVAHPQKAIDSYSLVT
jgi:non-ribosomal peptide synthetase component F